MRKSIGEAGEGTRGAIRLLEQAGMRFLNHIDPFDAGPYYGGDIDDLVPSKAYRSLKASGGEPDMAATHLYLIAREDAKGFRAVRADAQAEDKWIVVPPAALEALGAKDKDPLDSS